jgi:hypothetical protein
VNRRMLALAIAAALVFAGVQLTGCSRLRAAAGPSGTASPVEVTVVIKGAMPGLEKQFKTGDAIRIKASGHTIGNLSSIGTTATLDSVGTADGKLVAAAVPNEEDITLQIAGSAVQGDDAYRFDGERVWVNQDLNLISPFVSFTGSVIDIKETGK